VLFRSVETADQVALLGICERAWVQGFLYATPLTPADAARFMGHHETDRRSLRLRAAG
jgi:EAL domain-containing protein (putative c-di-GMP-specific phosphodiesterase class I)